MTDYWVLQRGNEFSHVTVKFRLYLIWNIVYFLDEILLNIKMFWSKIYS